VPVHGSPDVEHEPSPAQRPSDAQPPVQQSAPALQISPSARQVSWLAHRYTPGVVVGMQNPEQQLPLDEHVSPETWQLEPALWHTPPEQRFEQHCAAVVHAPPTVRHTTVSLQRPLTHPEEQQSAAVTQMVPAMPQPPTTWQRRTPSTDVPHRPEQQSPDVVQVSSVEKHSESGLTHTPDAQLPVQQSESSVHAEPRTRRP